MANDEVDFEDANIQMVSKRSGWLIRPVIAMGVLTGGFIWINSQALPPLFYKPFDPSILLVLFANLIYLMFVGGLSHELLTAPTEVGWDRSGKRFWTKRLWRQREYTDLSAVLGFSIGSMDPPGAIKAVSISELRTNRSIVLYPQTGRPIEIGRMALDKIEKMLREKNVPFQGYESTWYPFRKRRYRYQR